MCTVEHVFSVEKLALARGNTTPGILVRVEVEVEAWLHVAKNRVQVSHSGASEFLCLNSDARSQDVSV